MDEAWERAVEAACGGEEPQAVRSLTLDGALKCSQGRLPAPALLERFTQLRVLSIANVGLTSLADFPSLKHLERLILSDNRISCGLEFLVDAGLQSLRDLDLSNNKIQQLDDLAPLAQLNLLSLDLYECPITRVQNYRPKVFSLIKSLQYLDKVDAEDNERPESDEEEDDQEDDVEDDGVDDEDPGYNADTIFSSSGPGDQDDEDENDDEGEESDELDEEDDENVPYPAGANHVGQRNEETDSEEEEVDDEDDTEQVLEVQDVEESEEEEEAGEDEEDEEEDDEDEEEDGTEQASAGVDGEIDAQGEGEEDNSELGDEDEEGDEGVDDDEGDEEDEEEDLGTEYLVQPIARPEDEEGASDFEPGADDVEDDDDIDDDEEDAEPAAAALKRKRSKTEDDEEKEERPPKK